MGKNMNLSNLSPEEAQKILEVIQKDFELRQKEKERLSKIEEVVVEEETKAEVLVKNKTFNENCCIRCCETFGYIFNRKQTCQACKLFVCKSCSIYNDNKKGYVCKACIKEVELKQKSADWFYNNVSRRFKRFGSAKVVRTLYKHTGTDKFHCSDGDDVIMEEPEDAEVSQIFQADNESDSGYDPSLYSSFGQSGSSIRAKSRPSLRSVFSFDDEKKELDNGLFSPPPALLPLSPNGNTYSGPPHSPLESIETQTMPTPARRTASTPTQTNEELDNKEREKRDIYKEAFESTKRTEEAKFKVRFDNLVSDMQQSFDNDSSRDGQLPSEFGSTSYGDLMTGYRGRIKDLLVSLSQRLELAVESFDDSYAHSPALTSQKVRQMISKLVEDRLGESLDLTSDEAVSDLSSLSDDSTEQKSYEDQIAQAVVARVLELHRNQNSVHLTLDKPVETGTSNSSVLGENSVPRSRDSSVSEDKNVPNRTMQNGGMQYVTNPDVEVHVLDRERHQGAQSSHSTQYEDGRTWQTDATQYEDGRTWRTDSTQYEGGRTSRTDSTQYDNDTQGNHLTHPSKVRNQSDSSTLFEDLNNRRSVSNDLSNNNVANISLATDCDTTPSNGGLDSTDSGFSGNQNTTDMSPRRRTESDNVFEDVIDPCTNGEANLESALDVSEPEPVDDATILRQEFEKLRSFAQEVTPRPLYEEANFEENIEEEPIDEHIECEIVDRQLEDEVESRLFTFDKVHDSESSRHLPDFSDLDYEYHDFGVNEVDPDLLSMNLAPILEETEEELEEEEEEYEEGGEEGRRKHTEYEQDWKGNWIFKGAGGVSPYSNIDARNKIMGEFGDANMLVPEPRGEFVPQIGNKVVDDVSDMSENDDRDDSLDGLSDEENAFYTKTSEEIARITRKTSSSTHVSNSFVQTEGESDAESAASRPFSSPFSDAGQKANLDQTSFDSRASEKSAVKLSEELVPAEGDDPKFEIPPISTTVPEGEPAKLTCRVAGTQPLDVFWYKVTGEELEELETSENYEVVKDGGRQHLTVFNLTADAAGQYMCMAINDNGRCCQYFILKTKKNTQEQKKPEFLRTLEDVEVTEGQSVKFRCKVKGYPQPRVVWYKDGHFLVNQTNYRLEKFGNRDYLLAIDIASMDEDAEYSVLAKNIAGEVRSSAQLIVESKDLPESVTKSTKAKESNEKKSPRSESPEPKSPKSKSTEAKRSSSPEFPSLSYLRLGRSSAAPTASSAPVAPKRKSKSTAAKKQEQNLSNLGQKVAMTKDSVTDVAEDMLSSSKELSEIHKSIAEMDKILEELESDMYSSDTDPATVVTSPGDTTSFQTYDNYFMLQEAASNVRKATSSALDYLNNTESVVEKDKLMDDAMATSTPRSAEESVPSAKTHDISEDISEDSHKSEISFSVSSSKESVEKSQKKESVKALKSKQKDVPDRKVASDGAKYESHMDRQNISGDTSQSADSSNISMDVSDLNNTTESISSDSEHLRINLGPKREAKDAYRRDFYVTDTPKPARKVISPEPSPREEKKTAHTEEKIYLAAGTVYGLENKVQTLEDKMRAVHNLQEQDKLASLENQVARTVAQVATSERKVQEVEKSVNSLKSPTLHTSAPSITQPPVEKPEPTFLKGTVPSITQPPVEKPEPTFLKGDTSEQDLPESRTEFNEDYSIELPSVNRLKALFGGQKGRDSNVRQVHSITARSVPKDQLEKLKHAAIDGPDFRESRRPSNEPINPGRATALTTGQQIKSVPAHPKQVFQSQNVNANKQDKSNTPSRVTVVQQAPKQSVQISSNVKSSQSEGANGHTTQQPMKITLSAGATNRPISPVQSESSPQRPIRQTVTGSSQATPKSPVQSNTPVQTAKSGNEIDTPEGRKSPKIKTGAISAMSKFWEKKGKNEESAQAPEILEWD